MRRPAKGGTTHPTQQRPGMGYGRPLQPERARVGRADLLAGVQAFLRGESMLAEDDAALAPADRTAVSGLDAHR